MNEHGDPMDAEMFLLSLSAAYLQAAGSLIEASMFVRATHPIAERTHMDRPGFARLAGRTAAALHAAAGDHLRAVDTLDRGMVAWPHNPRIGRALGPLKRAARDLSGEAATMEALAKGDTGGLDREQSAPDPLEARARPQPLRGWKVLAQEASTLARCAMRFLDRLDRIDGTPGDDGTGAGSVLDRITFYPVVEIYEEDLDQEDEVRLIREAEEEEERLFREALEDADTEPTDGEGDGAY